MEQTECSKTSAYKIQTPGNYPEENIQVKKYSDFHFSYVIYLLCKCLLAHLFHAVNV